MFDYKKHFKMYKSGKLWVVAGIVSLSLLSGVLRLMLILKLAAKPRCQA